VSNPSDTTFGQSQIDSAFGIRTQERMRMNTRTMQPVAILADMSESFAPQRLVARGIAGVRLPAPGALNLTVYQIESRGAGGIIIEQITLGAVSTSQTDRWFQGVFPPPGTPGLAASNTIQQGGETTRSVYRSGTTALAGALTPVVSSYSAQANALPLDIFVAAGQMWELSWIVNSESFCAITWREIPEPLGAP